MDKTTVSDGEKLILVMLCEIYEHLGLKGEIDPKLVLSAVLDGHAWGLKAKYPGIYSASDDNPSVVSEVVDILDMWVRIEKGYDNLSDDEKKRVKDGTEHLGADVRFCGFDLNNESRHFGIASFLIEGLGRFPEFKDRDLNSHRYSLEGYRRMLPAYKRLHDAEGFERLSASNLVALMNAREHPSHRGVGEVE